jgi:hypothetical protein
MHLYEVRPRKDRRGFDLISDATVRPVVHPLQRRHLSLRRSNAIRAML